MSVRFRILGPKVPEDLSAEERRRYQLPQWMFAGAAFLLLVSLLLPYWVLNLDAPQFPDGLQIKAHVNRLVGDVTELEGLNHYVGLQSFEDGAVFERSIAVIAIITLSMLVVAALRVHSRWVVVLVLPALVFPIVFMADLQYWLWNYGHNLDPLAPFAAAVGEFTPPIFGPAKIAQFTTLALPGLGFVLAIGASALIGTGLWFHRKAWKPLLDESRP